MRNIGIALFFIMFLPGSGYCQWKAETHDFITDNTIYNIVEDRNVKAISFLFPEYEFYDHLSTKAYRLIDADKNQQKALLWETNFSYQGEKDFSEHFLLTDLYLKNVNQLSFLIYIPAKQLYYSKTVKVAYQGYQSQISNNLGAWDVSAEVPVMFKNCNMITSSDKCKIAMLAEPVNTGQKVAVYAADLLIVHGLVKHVSLPSDFYMPQVAKKNPGRPTHSSDYISEYISSSTDQEKKGVMGSTIYLSNLVDKRAERDLIDSAVLSSIKHYPFYAERGVNRDSALSGFRKITQFQATSDTAHFYNYVSTLSHFLKEKFHDPHLGITIPASNSGNLQSNLKVIRPVRVYNINNKLFVAAVFDKRYKSILPLGAEITKIDQKPVGEMMDSLKKYAPEESRNLNGEFLDGLGKHKSDSTVLTIRDLDGVERNTCIKYDGLLNVDEKFKSRQCYFTMLKGGTAYYQVSSWTLDVYRRFLNNWDSVKSARKVILDLRGNGGGIGLSVVRLLSVFLDKPASIYKIKDFHGNYSDPLVIKTNSFFHLDPAVKVIVLCDKNTACASEIFIAGILANRANTSLVGTEKTGGVLADRYDLNFPSKVVFYTDALIGKLYLDKFNCIETKGITPTSLVSINEIKDLKPYQDKVLRVAIGQ